MKKTFFILAFGLLGCLTAIAQKSLPSGATPIEFRQHIYLNCQFSDASGNFVFDTGATNLYFDSTFYSNEGFNFPTLANAILPGAGNTVQKVSVILDTVECNVDHSTYQTTHAPIFQLKPILGDIADGIIGLSHFSDRVLMINYQDEYLITYNDISEVQLSGFEKIPLKRVKDRLFVQAAVAINEDLTIDGEFLLDLGAAGGIIFNSGAGSRYNLGKEIEKKVKYSTINGGVGGASSSYVFKAQEVKVASYSFSDPIISFSLDTSGALSDKSHLGLFGNEILGRFEIIIDFKNNELYLKPNSSLNDPFTTSRHGFSYVDRSKTMGGWIVKGFYEYSDGLKKGLQAGDKIVFVDGIPVQEINYEDQHKLFGEKNSLLLTIEREGVRKDIEIQLSDPSSHF